MRNDAEKSMRRIRLQVLVIVMSMILGIYLSGCGAKDEKSKEETNDQRSAEIVVEDFCDFLRSGKLDRVEKLLDEKSEMLTKLQGYQQSPATGVLAEYSSQLTQKIKEVRVDPKEGSGTATVVFTSADMEEITDQITEKTTRKETRELLEEAKKEEFKFELELVKEDGWCISSDSADEVIETLFAFMEDLEIDTTPAVVATPTPIEYDIFSTNWMDGYYNEVDGYAQTDTDVIFMVNMFNDFETRAFYFVFKDSDENKLFEGNDTVRYSGSSILCKWEEASLVGLDTLYCYVYDQDQQLVTSGSIHIYGDDEVVPVRYHVSTIRLVDEQGNYVPGYFEGTTYVGIQIEIIDFMQNVEIPYGLYSMDYDPATDFNVALYEGTLEAESSVVVFPLDGLTPLVAGKYFFQTFKPDGSMKDIIFFDVKTEGETFEYSAEETVVLDQYFTFEAGEIQNKRDVSSDTDTIYFEFALPYTLDYVGFTYTLTDSAGTVLDEGKEEIFYSDRCSIKLNMKGASVGEMTIKVYNPNGKELTSYTIEVTE